jgi:hypothetical protein
MAWAEESVGSGNCSALAVAGTVQSNEAAAVDVLVAAANAVELAAAAAAAVGVEVVVVVVSAVAAGIQVASTVFLALAA